MKWQRIFNARKTIKSIPSSLLSPMVIVQTMKKRLIKLWMGQIYRYQSSSLVFQSHVAEVSTELKNSPRRKSHYIQNFTENRPHEISFNLFRSTNTSTMLWSFRVKFSREFLVRCLASSEWIIFVLTKNSSSFNRKVKRKDKFRVK